MNIRIRFRTSCILLSILVFAACASENKTSTFCNANYPILFEYPASMRWNDIVGLVIGSDHFFFNIGIEELNETASLNELLSQELDDQDEEPARIDFDTIGENEIAIASFSGIRSDFEKQRGLFVMKYWAITVVEDHVVRLVAFQNIDENERLLPTLKNIMGSVRTRSATNTCN
ncbi:MAG: hypothetical protein KDE51_19970 [Anaerolineales bacterium]|nr:hypothetical protein [Anaerolineales bacterium]